MPMAILHLLFWARDPPFERVCHHDKASDRMACGVALEVQSLDSFLGEKCHSFGLYSYRWKTSSGLSTVCYGLLT